MWRAARVALLIVEPGTPKGFALIRAVREQLLASGAHIAAPCPGAMACPMVDPDWCHFAARVERSSLHRRLKEGGDPGLRGLGNTAYRGFHTRAASTAGQRIDAAYCSINPALRSNLQEPCTDTGLKSERVSKRDREAFRAARRAAWGGAFTPGNM